MWPRSARRPAWPDTGTEEEFDHALRAWRRSGQPRMLCYFSRALGEPPETVEEAAQLLEVTRFRSQVEDEGLAWRYRSDAKFRPPARASAADPPAEYAGRRPPLDRNLLALLEVEKERCQDRDVAFVTPNLLVALLGARTGAARRIVDRARPGAVESLVTSLRRYEPLDNGAAVRPFEDFDSYDRSDVQAARRPARLKAARAIDAGACCWIPRHSGETRSALRQALGEDGFERLIRTAEASEQAIGTPGLGNFLVVPQAPAELRSA